MLDQFSLLPMDTPATYRICISGCLESDYAERYWGMTSSAVQEEGEPEQTVLLGEVADQAALVGIINTLYNQGYAVLTVERMNPKTIGPAEENL